MLGQTVTKEIEISNVGKLDGELKVKFEVDEFEEESDEISLKKHQEDQIYEFHSGSSFVIPIQFR